MKSMKKITACVLSTVFVVAVSDVAAASKSWSRQEEVADVQVDPAVQAEQQKPKPQNLPAGNVVAEVQAQEENVVVQEEVKRSRTVRDCCSRVMDEVQKLNNEVLAAQLCDMVAMIQTEEMQTMRKRCGCNRPKPAVSQVVQPKPVVQPEASTNPNEVPSVEEKNNSSMLLRECCNALLQEAERTCDCQMAERVNCIMQDVERMN